MNDNSIINIRKLQYNDLESNSGFFEALQSLDNREIDPNKAKNLFNRIKYDDNYNVYVAEMDCVVPIVGTATLQIDRKFIHNCTPSGRIENVAVVKEFRKMGIASQLIEFLIEASRDNGCYKVSLDCSEELIPYYQKFGFYRKSFSMRLDF